MTIAFALGFARQADAQLRLYPEPVKHHASSPTDLRIPPRPEDPPMVEDFYNEQLMAELRDRYQERFGPMELTYISPDIPGIDVIQINSFHASERDTVVARNAQLQRYGEFVVRRLAEFRLDTSLRRNPRSKDIYKAKEQLTDQKLNAGSFGQLRGRYVISGNYLEVRFRSPYFEVWVVRELHDGLRFEDNSWIYSGRMKLLDEWWLESSYRQERDLGFVGLRKQIAPDLVCTARFSQNLTRTREFAVVYEKLALIGVSLKY